MAFGLHAEMWTFPNEQSMVEKVLEDINTIYPLTDDDRDPLINLCRKCGARAVVDVIGYWPPEEKMEFEADYVRNHTRHAIAFLKVGASPDELPYEEEPLVQLIHDYIMASMEPLDPGEERAYRPWAYPPNRYENDKIPRCE